jgi:hypothetical protein
MIPGQTANVELPPDIKLTDDDFAVDQKEEGLVYPYISIRQKEPTDEVEGVVPKTGWWKVQNAAEPISDIEKLRITVLFWTECRTFFRKDDDTPYCKSIDNTVGSLKTHETDLGQCQTCQYSQFGEDGSKPPCAEGRNLYCMVENVGPAVVRLGVSSIRPWKAFDNLMGTKRIDRNGGTVRLPWHCSVVELRTKKITKKYLYWVVDPGWTGFNDKETMEFLRGLLAMKDQYDETAQRSDLKTEDVNGRQAPTPESEISDDQLFAEPTA